MRRSCLQEDITCMKILPARRCYLLEDATCKKILPARRYYLHKLHPSCSMSTTWRATLCFNSSKGNVHLYYLQSIVADFYRPILKLILLPQPPFTPLLGHQCSSLTGGLRHIGCPELVIQAKHCVAVYLIHAVIVLVSLPPCLCLLMATCSY